MAAHLRLFLFFFRARKAAKAISTITIIIAAIFCALNRLKYEFLFVLKNFLFNKDLVRL